MDKETEEEALVAKCIDEVKSQYVDWYNLGYQTCMAEKKEWVGLTGTEVNHIFAKNVGYPERMMKDVENLLKDKNGG